MDRPPLQTRPPPPPTPPQGLSGIHGQLRALQGVATLRAAAMASNQSLGSSGFNLTGVLVNGTQLAWVLQASFHNSLQAVSGGRTAGTCTCTPVVCT